MSAIFANIVAILPALVLSVISATIAYLGLKRHSRTPRILVTLAVSGATLFCAWYAFSAGIFLASLHSPSRPIFKPSATQFIGTWRMPHTLVEYLEFKGFAVGPHRLTLNEDGTFNMLSIPDLWGAPWDPSRPATSGCGTWEVVRVLWGSRAWVVQLHFNEVSPEAGNNEAEFYISGGQPPFDLYIPKGEMGDALILERE